MTSRERFLVLVGGCAALFLIAFVGYAFVWAPLTDAWDRAQAASGELAKVQDELKVETDANARILKLDPRLRLWRELSLPPSDPAQRKPGVPLVEQKERHLSNVKAEYERYLSNLMRNAGFKGETVVVTQKTPSKAGTTAAKGKEAPLFERLAFGVTAQGTQDAVYRAMRDFARTPVLHQVRDFTASVAKPKGRDKADPNVLDFSMTAEALIMAGGEDRSTVMAPKALPAPPVVLATANRDYLLMKKRSLFTGLEKPPEPPPVRKKEVVRKKEEPKPPPGPSREERLAVLEFVKLTMVAWNPGRGRWEATFYDQAQGKGDEIKVDTRLYKTFSIEDGDENVMLDGKVISISEEGLIFEADKKVYRARCGDFLDAVWKNPLSNDELKRLGLKKG